MRAGAPCTLARVASARKTKKYKTHRADFAIFMCS